MAKRNISFLHRWKGKMLTGQKIMTCRTVCMANPGDTFVFFGHTFLIKAVYCLELSSVANNFYDQEGCSSPEEFIAVWKEIHPVKGFKPNEIVFLHKFELQDSPIQGALLNRGALAASV